MVRRKNIPPNPSCYATHLLLKEKACRTLRTNLKIHTNITSKKHEVFFPKLSIINYSLFIKKNLLISAKYSIIYVYTYFYEVCYEIL